jgi:hypothetical protein
MHTDDFWPPRQTTAFMPHLELQSQVGEIRVSTEFSHHIFVQVADQYIYIYIWGKIKMCLYCHILFNDFRLINMFLTLATLSCLWIEYQIYFALANFKYTLHHFHIVSALCNRFLKCVSVKMKHCTVIPVSPFPDPSQPLQITISLSTFMNSTILYSHISKTMKIEI